MSLFTGILQSQAPPKQDATSTIQTLCLRLSSSTLLEDRRAAIMGLRSFARDYKEMVASEGLRGLIGTLSKDREDVDTIKVVMETLLLLFVKDESNPESSEDIALWLTDEFTQKQENITILIELLEETDFFIRLYTLQLLVAVLNNRPSRTQECVFTAPLGISRLVSTLDDKRDAIRNESILLIINLCNNHTDMQKLIAFENAFERTFAIIDSEGGIEGGIIVQDCLQLLSNLLSFNISNQSFFRETGGIAKLAKIFDIKDDGEIPPYAREQRNSNIEYALRVVRLFVVPGGLGTAANQHTLCNAGVLHLVLRIAFSPFTDLPIRAEALNAVADLIHGNAVLQEGFAQMQVNYLDPNVPPEAQAQKNSGEKCYVIEGLLYLALLTSSIHVFEARLAACRCLQAYFAGNQPVKSHFLNHAINLHVGGGDSANILSCLINLDSDSRGDPYRVWLASVILMHLLYDDVEAKELATSIKEGDAEAGEEVVTAIQHISANLIAALQHHYDPRICIGYLMLLCIWLYEDSPAVDDFLSEGASVQSLVAAVTQSSNANPIVQGLCAFLLGILYEFSHKDSPLSRATLHPILASRMGRDHYLNRITKLRENPMVRDFEVTRLEEDPHRRRTKLPEVYFDQTFIDFLKDNYSRILRAIDKDPGVETHTSNGVSHPNGITAELVDSLKTQLEDKDEALSKAQTNILTLEQKVTQEQHELQRIKDFTGAEIQRLKDLAESTKRTLLAEADVARKEHAAAIDGLRKRFETEITSEKRRHSGEVAGLRSEAKREKEKAKVAHEKDVETRESKFATIMENYRKKHEEGAAAEAKKNAQVLEAARRQLKEEAAKEKTKFTAAIEEERRKVEALGREKKVAEEKIQSLQANLQQSQQGRDSVMEASKKEIEALNAKIATLEQTLSVSTKDHASLLESLKAKDEELSALKSESTITKVSLKTAEEALDRTRTALKTAEETLAAATKKLTAAETSSKSTQETLDSTKEQLKSAEQNLRSTESRLIAAEEEVKASEKAVEAAKEKVKAAEGSVEAVRKEKVDAEAKAKEVQTELDDLFMVLGDLEEKRKADKKRLKALGEEVSDDEDEDDEDEE
ncbi:Vesicle-mediated ER to Golgi transport protein [Rhizina undulata]